MILYHGSQEIVQTPVFGRGKKENDYGQGFYCTESPELAREWACPILKDGFVNRYDLDTEGLSVLRLNGGEYHILNWLALLLCNRRFDISRNKQVALRGREYIIENFMPDIRGFDVIVGYRADDRYFAFARDFIQNGISLRQLADAMKLGELGEQVVLMSEKAFGHLRFLSYETAESGVYYSRRIEREARADEAFRALHGEAALPDSDIFMLDILREGIRNDDARLR